MYPLSSREEKYTTQGRSAMSISTHRNRVFAYIQSEHEAYRKRLRAVMDALGEPSMCALIESMREDFAVSWREVFDIMDEWKQIVRDAKILFEERFVIEALAELGCDADGRRHTVAEVPCLTT